MDNTYAPEAWKRLGAELEKRRGKLGYGFRQRDQFLRDRGGVSAPSLKMIARLERGERTSYPPATVAALEALYDVEPGSFERALQGGELSPAVTPPAPRQPSPGEPPMTEEAFVAYLLPAQNEYDRQVLEAVMRLCDGEGRLLPWPARWEYISVVLTLRHGRNGQEAGLIPPVVESELLLNPHAREIARHAHQIRRKPCGPPLSAVPMDTECDCFTPVASRGGWGVPVKRPGGEQQCRR